MRSRTLLLRLECGLALGLFFVLVELLKAFRAWSYAGETAYEWAGVAVVLRIYTAFLFLWAQGRPRPRPELTCLAGVRYTPALFGRSDGALHAKGLAHSIRRSEKSDCRKAPAGLPNGASPSGKGAGFWSRYS